MGEYSMIQIALKPTPEIVIHLNEDVDSHDECECRWCYFNDKECWCGKGRIVMNSAICEAQHIYNGSEKYL